MHGVDEKIECRRPGDGELLGWIQPEGDGFVGIDLLGHRRTGVVDWLDAEEALEELGIGYLAEPYELLLALGEWVRVRLAEVSVDGIRLKGEDWGAIDAPQVLFTLPFPAPAEVLRPLTR